MRRSRESAGAKRAELRIVQRGVTYERGKKWRAVERRRVRNERTEKKVRYVTKMGGFMG